MINISANAMLNLKEVPQKLQVHGSIMTYRPDDIISIKKAVPQGITETILILELLVKEGVEPMKGTPKPFFYESSEEIAKTYKQVMIQYGDESITVDVQVFG